MLILAGPRFNILGEGTLSVTSENARLLKAGLFDGDPDVPWQAGSLVTPQRITLDGNLAQNTNWSFETAGTGGQPFAMWTKLETGTGSVTRVAGGGGNPTPINGSWECKLSKAAQGDAAAVMIDFLVRSGSYVSLPIFAYDMTVKGVLRIQNLETGNFLQNALPQGQLWAPAVSDYYFGGAAEQWNFDGFHDDDPLTGDLRAGPPILIEPVTKTKRFITRIRILMGFPAGVPSATGWLDYFSIYYGASFASLHHHTIPPGTAVTVESSPEATTWTTRGTFAMASLAQPECYLSFTHRDARFWRFSLAAFTPHGAAPAFLATPAIGEAVLGQALAVQGTWRTADLGYEMGQARMGESDRYRQALQAGEAPRIVLERTDPGALSFPEALNQIFRPSLGGVRPAVVAWDESDPTAVIYGFVDAKFGGKRDIHRAGIPHQLAVNGFAPPLWTP